LLWIDSNEVVLLFYNAAVLIPDAVFRNADNKFIQFFASHQQPTILTYLNTCLEEDITIDFNFNWADASAQPSASMTGRLNPIKIDHKKTIIFTII
jgi:hypothetical protein